MELELLFVLELDDSKEALAFEPPLLAKSFDDEYFGDILLTDDTEAAAAAAIAFASTAEAAAAAVFVFLLLPLLLFPPIPCKIFELFVFLKLEFWGIWFRCGGGGAA